MNQVAKAEEVVTDPQGEAEFGAAFEEVAHMAELSPEEQEQTRKAAEEKARADALAAETPEAKKAREDAEAAATETARKADEEKARSEETPEARAAREKVETDAAEKATKDAEEKARADAAVKVKTEADEKARFEAEKNKQETPEAKVAREAYEESIKPYAPSEAEVKALAQFEKDFPNEYAALDARLKGVDRETNAKVHAAVTAALGRMAPRLSAVEALAGETAQDRHFSELRRQHADYDAVIPKVADWIKSQPAYLQPAMQAVYDGGTTADVGALVADYKKASGVATAVDGAAEAAAEKGRQAAEKAAAAKKKAQDDAAALQPVGSRRSVVGPKGKADVNDYDGAFDEAAAAFTAGK